MPGISAHRHSISLSIGQEAISSLGENYGLKMYFYPDLS